MKIDVMNYLDEEEVKDICKSALYDEIRSQYSNRGDIKVLLSNIGYQTIMDAITENLGEDSVEIIKERTKDILSKESSYSYCVMRRGDNLTEKSLAYSIMEEEVKENRSIISERVKEVLKNYNLEGITEFEIKSCLEDLLYEKLFNNKEKV